MLELDALRVYVRSFGEVPNSFMRRPTTMSVNAVETGAGALRFDPSIEQAGRLSGLSVEITIELVKCVG